MADHDEVEVDPQTHNEAIRRHTMAASKKGVSAVIKQGEMYKQGGNFKTWKKRWFVLLHDTIAYFDREGGKIKGGILLETVKTVRDATELECKKANAIAIETTVSRTYIMHTTEKDERLDWIAKISEAKENLANVGVETVTPKAPTGSIGTAYLSPGSVNSFGVWNLLKMSGFEFEEKIVSIPEGETRTPEFLEMNPLHTLPVFKSVDGTVIMESNAILRFICNRYPMQMGKYYPADPDARAAVDVALDFRQNELIGPLSSVAYPYLKFGQLDDEAQGKSAASLIEKNQGLKDGALTVLETFLLKNKQYIGGSQITIADIAIRSALALVDATVEHPNEVKLSERIQKYVDDVDAATQFKQVSKEYQKYICVVNGRPVPEEPKEEPAAAEGVRYNTVQPQPENAKFKVAVVEFNVPDAKNGGTDKGPDGHRIDSIPIANGIIATGNSCEIIKYFHDKHEEFTAQIDKYDALIVRINPGQLSQGTGEGTQERFDALMNAQLSKGKLVWSSPGVQTCMGAKDALVKIKDLSCGLADTLAYYDNESLAEGFKKTMAFQPRVIKQNRGSAGEGIWLCWLEDKEYCANYGDAVLDGSEKLKLMEMNDNHVEYHTCDEFIEFCVNGPGGKAGEWKSTFPGKYLEGGKAAGGQLVDQRLLPRISEGEVRMLMVGDSLQQIIHKKPEDGLSAVGGNSLYTFYKPGCEEYANLEKNFFETDLPQLMKALEIENDPLPILWTADFIPRDGDVEGTTDYVVGEFNCSCVGISKFQAVCGGEKTLADVSDEDYWGTIELPNMMGTKAIEMLEAAAAKK